MNSTKNDLWTQIIDSGPKELFEMRVFSKSALSEDQLNYLEVMLLFLKKETEALAILVQSWKSEAAQPWQILARLRLLFRQNELSSERFEAELASLQSSFSENQSDHQERSMWSAEASFIFALAAQRKEEFETAQISFEQASEFYAKADCKKKALRSAVNAVAAFSCRFPESRLIPEYKSLLEKARTLQDWFSIVGLAVNLSREMHRLGNLTSSLQFAEEACGIAERELYFTREHHLALLQKAHLLFILQRFSELDRIAADLASSPFPEVAGSFQVLAEKINLQKFEKKTDADVLPTWRERGQKQNEFKSSQEKSGLQLALIDLLLQGPQAKEELIAALYGDLIDILTLETRFKNLLLNIRKKHPGLISYRNSRYEITDIAYARRLRGAS